MALYRDNLWTRRTKEEGKACPIWERVQKRGRERSRTGREEQPGRGCRKNPGPNPMDLDEEVVGHGEAEVGHGEAHHLEDGRPERRPHYRVAHRRHDAESPRDGAFGHPKDERRRQVGRAPDPKDVPEKEKEQRARGEGSDRAGEDDKWETRQHAREQQRAEPMERELEQSACVTVWRRGERG